MNNRLLKITRTGILSALLLMLVSIIPDAGLLAEPSGAEPAPLFIQQEAAAASPDTTAADAKVISDKIASLDELFSVNKIISAIILLLFTFLFNRALLFLLGRLAENKGSYRLIIKRLIPFLNILIWALAIYAVIAGIIDPPVETVLAVGASVGIAVGFAAQDILKNIFGGFIIIMDRPFQVGDKIEVGNYYGEVTAIGLRSTRIVTPDDSAITVPNAELVNNSVSNTNSGALFCQVVSEVYLPATTNLAEVREVAYKAAISSRYVFLNQPVVVLTENVLHERNFAIKLKIKAYVLDIRYEFRLKSEITELVLEELNRRSLIPAYNRPPEAPSAE